MADRRKSSVGLPISERKVLLGFGDLLATVAAVLVALRIWSVVGARTFDLGFVMSQAHWFVILGGVWLTLASANNFFDLALSADWLQSLGRLLQITVQLLVVYLLIFFLSPRDALPRLFILYYAVASTVFISLWRLARPFLVGWRPTRRRVVIVGVGWPAQAIVDAINRFAPEDYEIVGIVDEGQPVKASDVVIDADVVGDGGDLANVARELDVGEVVLATSGNVEGALFQAIMDCYELGVPITPMPLLYEQLSGMVPVRYVGGHWNVVLPLEGRSPFDPYPMLKRLMDVGFSLIGLVLFVTMLPLLALLMMLDSPGPIFYAQERVGKAGKLYKLYKLRTMIPDAERDKGPIWAVQGDPRVTRLGRFLRKSRLDEVPQLWNVLRGQMTLIGPRPERPAFVADLQQNIPFYRARLVMEPGITGWAQVNYHYGSTVEDAVVKLQYDLYYIRHRSLLLDALILFRTVGQVVALKGV